MRVATVRNRAGKQAIHWPGVLVATAVIAVFYGIGVAAFSLAMGWFSPLSLIFLPILVGATVGRSVRLGLHSDPSGCSVTA